MSDSLSSGKCPDNYNSQENHPDGRLFFENLLNSLETKSSVERKNISPTNDNYHNKSRRCRRSTQRRKKIVDQVCHDEKCHPTHRVVDWLVLPFFAFVFFLILASPDLDRILSKHIPQVGYRWLAKGLLFFIIIYLLDRAITQWRIDTFSE